MGGVKLESVAKADWRIDKKEKDDICEAKQVVEKKPHHIGIKVGGVRVWWEKCLGWGGKDTNPSNLGP